MDKTIKILLIEDNHDYARLIKRLLTKKESSSMAIEHRDTFAGGYECLLSGDFDLILLDLNLPDSGADKTLASIRGASDIPIIVLTGNEDEATALKAVQQGAQDYLNKGDVDGKLLVRTIRYAVERSKVYKQLKKTEERFRLLIENALDLISIVEVNGDFKFVSPSHKSILGYSEDELMGKRLFDFIHPEDLSGFIDTFTHGLSQPESSYTVEYRMKNKYGKWVTIESIAKIFPADSAESGVVFNSRDISERKEFEDTLLNLSITDELTDLYNRRGLMMIANHYFKSADRKNERVLLVLIDVDDLKRINDGFGHNEGDRALVATSRLAKNTFRDSDVIARVGGDEFVVLSVDSELGGADAIAKRINRNLDKQNAELGLPFNLSISLGVAVYNPSDPRTVNDLISIADKRMYKEKESKHSRKRSREDR